MANNPDLDVEEVSPHVHVRISPEKKIEWLNYAYEHYRGNLSTLIVKAVDQIISDEWVLAGDAEANRTVDVDTSGLDNDLNDIKSQLAALSDQVDTLTLAGSQSDIEELDRTSLIKLSNRIRDVLLEVPSEEVFRSLVENVPTVEAGDRVAFSGTVHDIADYLEEHRHHVHDAAVFLENNESPVKSIIHDGTRRWFVLNPHIKIEEVWPKDAPWPEDDEFETGSEATPWEEAKKQYKSQTEDEE